MRAGDDSGSIFLAMLLVLIGSSLAALMIPMFLVQINSTQSDLRRLHALDAAQTGIDVALGHIRAAADTTGAGALSSLPCSSITGTVVGAVSYAQYQVNISYFASDPHGQSASWLASNAILCLVGSGTKTTPGWALVQSIGTDSPSGSFTGGLTRTLQATYIFQTTNQNIAGGLIHIYKTTSTDLCLAATSGSPAAGSQVSLQPCSSGSVAQTFAYNTNLTLSLVASQTTANPLGMCLDGSNTPATAGTNIVFQKGATTTSFKQQWSLNDSANFAGTNDGVSLNTLCFNVATPNTQGSLIVLSTNCNGAYDSTQTFSPDASVGAGMAGVATHQLVNYSEFGRCLDIPGYDTTQKAMIAWPCKQTPNGQPGWNQQWFLPTAGAATGILGVGPITVVNGSTVYCLQSPGSGAAGSYVPITKTNCSASTTQSNLVWTVYGQTNTYGTSYRIQDYWGDCLQPTDPTATNPDFFQTVNQVSWIIVATCNNSTLQKWNAPPGLQNPAVKDVGEK